MAEGITVELVGFRTLHGRFAKASQELRNAMRDAARNLRQPLVKLAKAASPVGTYPFGEPQGHVHFRDSWATAFKQTSSGGQLTLYNHSDHAKLVMFPTKAHTITAHKKTLRFMTKDGEVLFRRTVSHPGTKGNDVLNTIQADVEKLAQTQMGKAAQRASVGFRRAFSG